MKYDDILKDIADEDRAKVPPHIAAINIRNQNKQNRSLYTDEQHSEGEDLRDRVSAAWPARPVLGPDYLRGFIRVKVQGVRNQDRIRPSVRELNNWCQENGIEVGQSKSGSSVWYKIPRVRLF